MPRVTIYLPEDHPLTTIPSGRRSSVVREALDANQGLVELMGEIRDRLARIESRLDQLERVGISASSTAAPGVAAPPAAPAGDNHADVKLDMSGFDDL